MVCSLFSDLLLLERLPVCVRVIDRFDARLLASTLIFDNTRSKPRCARTVRRVGETVEVQSLSTYGSVVDDRGARRPVVLSGVALAVQVAATDYGAGPAAAAGFWFVLGCLLLWLVYQRRSRAARGFIIVTSLAGAVVYGLVAFGDTRSAFLALAFLAQAAPLMTGQVRRHVQAAA